MDLEVVENSWTIEEDIYLYKCWEFYTVRELARKLNKSKEDVKQRIFDLKLRQNPDGSLPVYIFLFIITVWHGYNHEVIGILSRKFNVTQQNIKSKIRHGKRGYGDFTNKIKSN